MTYNATEDDVPPSESILVLGSGKYRIGYGCDNDWNVVACLEELHKQGESSIVVSCNPQSVATGRTSSSFVLCFAIVEHNTCVHDHCIMPSIHDAISHSSPRSHIK